MKTMEWETLLSNERLGGELVIDKKTEEIYPRTDFEKDYKRIISSASFRRLQDKTQVFPLDKSDFVRTRLTHSYETSVIAKMMGNMLASGEKYALEDIDSELKSRIPDILACAGLLHDIGNPPFGHFGEDVIRNWFKHKLKKYFILDERTQQKMSLDEILKARHIKDLQNFDGNAQALRLLTKLHFQDGICGMNLTVSVLNSLVKYPAKSEEVGTAGSLLKKKMGYTDADSDVYERITEITEAKGVRHPLAYILEAADDIAYKTADIEDAVKKGLLDVNQLLNCEKEYIEATTNYDISKMKDLFDRLQDIYDKAIDKEVNNPHVYAIRNWIPYAQEWLMYCAVYGFWRNKEEIMTGTYNYDLFKGTYHEATVKFIDTVMSKYIFINKDIVKLELSADTILTNLLDKFIEAVIYHDKVYTSEDNVEIKAYKKLYMLISENYCDAYKKAKKIFEDNTTDENEKKEYDIYLRLLLVVDFISGMTDSYAKRLYQELNGFSF